LVIVAEPAANAACGANAAAAVNVVIAIHPRGTRRP
jgi:hypothetical protein